MSTTYPKVSDLPPIEKDPRFLKILKDYKCKFTLKFIITFTDTVTQHKAANAGMIAGLLS